jgi:hypothetical protein
MSEMHEELKDSPEADEEVEFDLKNPLAELLSEIEAVLQASETREALLDEISRAFKKRQRSVFSSTWSLWFRKYEKEVESKHSLQRRLERTVAMNKILSKRLMDAKKEAGPAEDTAGLGAESPASRHHLDDATGDQSSLALEQAADCPPEPFDEHSVTSIGTTTCPLCSRHLDDVYEQLETKDRQVKSLSKQIATMNCGGQMLISQNNMCKEEMSRLVRYKTELTLKSSALEGQVCKLRAETTESKRHYIGIIEQYRRQNEELKINLSAVEAKLESCAREAMRSSQGRSDLFNFSSKRDACVGCSFEEFSGDQTRKDSPLTTKPRAGVQNEQPLAQSIVTTRHESNSETSSKNLNHSNRPRFLTNIEEGFRSDGKLRGNNSSQLDPPQTSLKVEEELKSQAQKDWFQNDTNESNSRQMRSTAAFKADLRLTLDKQQTKGTANPKKHRTKSDKKKTNSKVKGTESYNCTLI